MNEKIQQVIKPLNDVIGVSGVMVLDGEKPLFHSLPLDSAREKLLCQQVHGFLDGYRQVGRDIKYIVMTWKSLSLLLCTAGFTHVAVLFRDTSVLDELVELAPDIVAKLNQEIEDQKAEESRKVARVKLIEWQEVIKRLTAILSKVVSYGQAERMIYRQIEEQEIDISKSASLTQLRKFTNQLMAQVGHRTKQRLLEIEAEAYLAQFE